MQLYIYTSSHSEHTFWVIMLYNDVSTYTNAFVHLTVQQRKLKEITVSVLFLCQPARAPNKKTHRAHKHLHEFYDHTKRNRRSFHLLCTFVEAIKSLLFYPNRSHLKHKIHINVPLIGCFAS